MLGIASPTQTLQPSFTVMECSSWFQCLEAVAQPQEPAKRVRGIEAGLLLLNAPCSGWVVKLGHCILERDAVPLGWCLGPHHSFQATAVFYIAASDFQESPALCDFRKVEGGIIIELGSPSGAGTKEVENEERQNREVAFQLPWPGRKGSWDSWH